MAGKRPNKKSRGMISEPGSKARKERRRNKTLARFAKRKRDLAAKVENNKELSPGEKNRASKYRLIVKPRMTRNTAATTTAPTVAPAGGETVVNPPS